MNNAARQRDERIAEAQKGQIFNIMDRIENKTGKMLHELDNVRFKRIIDTMSARKLSLAMVSIKNWYDEVI